MDCSLKILDFGMARVVDQTFMMTPYVVMRCYRAPEIILEAIAKYKESVDMWSTGCIFAEMVRGEILLPGKDYIEQWNKVTQILGTPPPDFFKQLQPKTREYCETQPRYKGRSWTDLFPDDAFPSDVPEDKVRTQHARDFLSKMLQVDPNHRITVDEALAHPYVNIWFDDAEVNAPPPPKYDQSIDEKSISLERWKELNYEEIKSYKSKM